MNNYEIIEKFYYDQHDLESTAYCPAIKTGLHRHSQ